MYPAPPQPDSDFVLWLGYLKELILFLGLVAAAFLAYTKFVIERGIFPPAQLNIQCKTLGHQGHSAILEVLVCVKNIGGSVLVVSNLNIELMYLLKDDEPTFLKIKDPEEWHLLGRLKFLHSLKQEACKVSVDDPMICIADKDPSGQGLCMLSHRTFVKPGVEQLYTYITYVPASASFVRILASFEYPKEHSLLERVSMDLSRRLGLINYTLKRIDRPHTCERAFKVDT
jgi:hypothetical protein